MLHCSNCLHLVLSLLPTPECWDYKHAPSCLIPSVPSYPASPFPISAGVTVGSACFGSKRREKGCDFSLLLFSATHHHNHPSPRPPITRPPITPAMPPDLGSGISWLWFSLLPSLSQNSLQVSLKTLCGWWASIPICVAPSLRTSWVLVAPSSSCCSSCRVAVLQAAVSEHQVGSLLDGLSSCKFNLLLSSRVFSNACLHQVIVRSDMVSIL